MLPNYVSSNDICDSLGISKRTLQRRFYDDENKLPEPCIKRVGGKSIWEESRIQEWLKREIERSKKLNHGGFDE